MHEATHGECGDIIVLKRLDILRPMVKSLCIRTLVELKWDKASDGHASEASEVARLASMEIFVQLIA